MIGTEWLGRALANVRQAGRGLMSRRLWTAAVVVTVALGVGANAAVFTVIDEVLLEALPYPEPERLVFVWARTNGGERTELSGPEWADLMAEVDLFESVVGIFGGGTTGLTVDDGPIPVTNRSVSSAYFDVFGVGPLIGRTFVPEDDFKLPLEVIRDAEAQWPRGAAVITYELWQSAYGGDPDVLGRFVELGNRPKEIVGVMPPGFQGLLPAALGEPHVDIWEMQPFDQASFPRDTRFVRVLTRMRPGVRTDDVQTALDRFSARQRATHPEEARAEFRAWAASLKGEVTQRARGPLILLLATVGVVLLIACVNVATLMVARADERAQELGLRRALGASGRDLFALAVTESLFVAGAGALVAMAVAWPLAGALVRMAPAGTLTTSAGRPDASVLAFTAAVALLVAFVTAVLPAVRGARAPTPGASGGSRVSAGRPQRHTASALVALQVALALVLSVGAGLLLRSFSNIVSVDPGFEVEGLRTARIDVPRGTHPTWEERVAFFRRTLEALRAAPGVEEVGIVDPLPFEGIYGTVATVPGDDGDRGIAIDYRKATPGTLEALGLEVLRGRPLRWEDLEDFDRLHAVVDERFAEVAFAGSEAVGRTIGIDRREYGTGSEVWDETKSVEIVGVVRSMRGRDLRLEDRPTVWVTYSQNMWGTPGFLLRTGAGFAPASVRETITGVDAGRLVFAEGSLEELARGRFASVRFALALAAIFGTLGLVLAMTGVYGLLAFTVGQRRKELHVRAALGADRRRLLRLVLAQGAWIVLAGLALGSVAAFWVTRSLTSYLYDITPTDPATFLGICALLAVTGAAACWLPGVRAASADPADALRAE